MNEPTIFQRVGDWKENHWIGLMTCGLIDDLCLDLLVAQRKIRDLEQQIEGMEAAQYSDAIADSMRD